MSTAIHPGLTIARIAFTSGGPVIVGLVGTIDDGHDEYVVSEIPIVLSQVDVMHALSDHNYDIDATIAHIGYIIITKAVLRGMLNDVPRGTSWQGFVSPMIGLN